MIAVLGLGYVGLPLSLALVSAGRRVVGFDPDTSTVKALIQGSVHIADVSAEAVSTALGAGLTVTDDVSYLADCDTFLICVPTPLDLTGHADDSFVRTAVASIAPHLRVGSLVVLESTCYPGATETLVAQELSRMTGLVAGRDFCVGFSPERVDPGNPNFSLRNTPKVVAGLMPCCLDRVTALYSTISDEVVPTRGLREAEFAKLLENTYRLVNISLINEFSLLSREIGIDLQDAINAASTKPFGFQAFYPGPGIGGHCIPVDPKFLSGYLRDAHGSVSRFVELALEVNEAMPLAVVDRLSEVLSLRDLTLDDASVLLLGVAYKPGVNDTRESPATSVARILRQRGCAVSYLDPYVADWAVDEIAVHRLPADTRRSAHTASVLLTQHPEFDALDLSALSEVCLDTRGSLAGANIYRM